MIFNDVRLEKSNTAILDAALLVLIDNVDTPFTDIAKAAGVGRATLYRIYPTRDLLIEALIIRCLDHIDSEMLKVEKQALSTKHFFELFFETMLTFESEYKFMYQFDPQSHPSAKIKQRCSQQHVEMVQLVELAQSGGLMNKQLPNEWIVRLIDGFIYAAWEFNRTEKNVKKSAQLAVKSLLEGTGTPGFFRK